MVCVRPAKGACYKLSGGKGNSYYWARDEAEKLIMLWSFLRSCSTRSKSSRNARLQRLKFLLQHASDADDSYPEDDGNEASDNQEFLALTDEAGAEEDDHEAMLEDGVVEFMSAGEVQKSAPEGPHDFGFFKFVPRAGFARPEKDSDDESAGYPESDDDGKDWQERLDRDLEEEDLPCPAAYRKVVKDMLKASKWRKQTQRKARAKAMV